MSIVDIVWTWTTQLISLFLLQSLCRIMANRFTHWCVKILVDPVCSFYRQAVPVMSFTCCILELDYTQYLLMLCNFMTCWSRLFIVWHSTFLVLLHSIVYTFTIISWYMSWKYTYIDLGLLCVCHLSSTWTLISMSFCFIDILHLIRLFVPSVNLDWHLIALCIYISLFAVVSAVACVCVFLQCEVSRSARPRWSQRLISCLPLTVGKSRQDCHLTLRTFSVIAILSSTFSGRRNSAHRTITWTIVGSCVHRMCLWYFSAMTLISWCSLLLIFSLLRTHTHTLLLYHHYCN